ncbi:MAG: succinate--CoA ligase subunit beta [Bacteroidetes bacterium GWF2_42_66]|nr:MAG: succinate--CoA ligase subunit beta [Bacteroidetes bacterium GWA2_42_15]OFX96116.1 MAG: succinate--CoA ligase subunit beta [Bacteroidetes bacterium GWE2_42_39]OFY45182.1 MAG: succinate--CoA ligase subunit beta [Bacteroidetes bacterium GWF2_42_66]HBL73585.1 ADP-forming succinate--CoA ligase subunit beta [Prolixibacteraceae bacterium]HCU60915.1 ADP-forming succinate--CoA ligase subunit beta [Prolixibacteraceae bacterium]
MKIHEYQARQIFREYGIPVPDDKLCHSVKEVEEAVANKNGMTVIKAQVLAGGRGKAGGVKLAKTKSEAVEHAKKILGMDIKGYTVEKVLVTDAVDIKKEFYVGLINDRNTKSVILMVSAEGGVEIEEVAKTNPEKIIKYPIDPLTGLLDYEARNIAMKLFGDIKLVRQAASIFQKLYKLYVATDSTLAEINPLIVNTEDQIWAIDGKMNFDDNALFRQPEILAMREPDEDELKEIDAHEKGLSYIKLDGTIGCMVNGAGLAMATMDMIKLYGGSPANFLDIGGSSNPQKVVDAMNILLSDKNVKAVMINIFGGITRCDDVARGLIKALKIINTDVPIVVRLSGTNATEGLAMIEQTGLPTVKTMSEAAKKAIELSNR